MASVVDGKEKICENVQRSTSIEISACEKRPIEREMETENPEEKKVDSASSGGLAKRIRLSNDISEPSKLVRPTISRPVYDRRFSFRDGSADDDDDMDDKNMPTIKIVAKKVEKKPMKTQLVRRKDRSLRKSTMSTRNTSTQSIKKKIKIIRKRRTPSVRTQPPSVAAWIRKYGIEDCCVRLDLYNPVADMGKH